MLKILKEKFLVESSKVSRGDSMASSKTVSGKADVVAESSPARKRGMVLPFEAHSITFDEIIYSVDMPHVSYC